MQEEHSLNEQIRNIIHAQPSEAWSLEYLATMKNNLDHQSTLITQQSNMISQQSLMITKLLSLHTVKSSEILTTDRTANGGINNPIDIEDELIRYFKCQMCRFEADGPSKLDSHVETKHRQ